MQLRDGSFIYPPPTKLPYGTERPGVIRYYEGKRLCDTVPFATPSGTGAVEAREAMDTDTRLGLNLFTVIKKPSQDQLIADAKTQAVQASVNSPREQLPSEVAEPSPLPAVVSAVKALLKSYTHLNQLSSSGGESKDTTFTRKVHAAPTQHQPVSSSGAKAELNLLADLLGASLSLASSRAEAKGGGTQPTFRLSLFPGDDDFLGDGAKGGSTGGDGTGGGVLEIDLTYSRPNADLGLGLEGWAIDEKEHGSGADEEDDLLALMDSSYGSK